MGTKIVNGVRYATCVSDGSEGFGICVNCERKMVAEVMVCRRNFSRAKPSPSRTDDDKLFVINKHCQSCRFFVKKSRDEDHRCKKAGCQQVSLWKRLDRVRWQCPVGHWGDKARLAKKKWTSTRMLVRDTMQLIEILPADVDAIIGVPRSGMIPASIIAASLHLPLYSISDSGVTECGSGARFKDAPSEFKNALLVDDTLNRGLAMGKAKAILDDLGVPSDRYTTACVYATPMNKELIDIFAKPLPNPHRLEWNFFNSIYVSTTAFDIDGILCPDVPNSMDDDGEKYIEYLKNAPVKYPIRLNPAGFLVTARLEKYRDVTEEWLEKNGILYNKLIMGPWDSNEEREVKGVVAEWKSEFYKNATDIEMFVESSDCIASQISRLAEKPVICPQTERIYG